MIYVMGTEDCWWSDESPYVKIGFTESPATRLHRAQVDNPHKVVYHYLFEGDREVEKELHRKFSNWHYRGEWFRVWGPDPVNGGNQNLWDYLDDEWLFRRLPRYVTND